MYILFLPIFITASDGSNILANIVTYIATCKPTLYMGDTLCRIHDATSLDWYATIILFTMVFRFVMMGQAHITSRKVHFSVSSHYPDFIFFSQNLDSINVLPYEFLLYR